MVRFVFCCLILLFAFYSQVAFAGERLMVNVPEVSPEMEPVLFERLHDGETVEQKWLYAALTAQQTTLRAYAATALGKAGDKRAVPYLIQALSDQSMHDGANYVEPGMATTRYRANQSLKALTGMDFGFIWNAPEADRERAVQKWIAWNERIERAGKQGHSGTNSGKEEISELDAIAIAAKAQAKESSKYQGFKYKVSKVPKEWIIIVWYVVGYFPDGKPQFTPGGFSAVHVSDTTGEVLKIVPGC